MMQDPNRPFNLDLVQRSARKGWDAFMWELDPALTLAVISDKARLREVHLHGWTIAVPESQLQFYGRHRDRLESALTRAHNGSPKCVHLVGLGK